MNTNRKIYLICTFLLLSGCSSVDLGENWSVYDTPTTQYKKEDITNNVIFATDKKDNDYDIIVEREESPGVVETFPIHGL